MTAAANPPLKRLTSATDRLSSAEPTGALAGSSAPKVVAEGVPSALLSDPHPVDGRRPVAWLHIVAPDDWRAPVEATSRCECGRYDHATNRRAVLALVEAHNAHRDLCPLRHPVSERSRAA